MNGRIVEIDGRSGELYVVVDMRNYEDIGSCSYARDYFITPYIPHWDNMQVVLNDTEILKVRGTKLPLKPREDKMPYVKYGYSNIRGIETLYFERIWKEETKPSR